LVSVTYITLVLTAKQDILYFLIVGYNLNTIKNTEALTDASREVVLEVNTGEIKYKLMSRHHNAGENHNTGIALSMWRTSNIWERQSQIKI
jgi:hypothetical protein